MFVCVSVRAVPLCGKHLMVLLLRRSQHCHIETYRVRRWLQTMSADHQRLHLQHWKKLCRSLKGHETRESQTCGWCADSAGSPEPGSSHKCRAWQPPHWTGRSAAGGSAGLHQEAGRPPWTCPPRPERSTWDQWEETVTACNNRAALTSADTRHQEQLVDWNACRTCICKAQDVHAHRNPLKHSWPWRRQHMQLCFVLPNTKPRNYFETWTGERCTPVTPGSDLTPAVVKPSACRGLSVCQWEGRLRH